MNRVVLVCVIGAGAACSEPQQTAPTQLNLDRPVDLSFACYGGMRVTNGRAMAMATDPIVVTAQPATSCDRRSLVHGTADPEFRSPGQDEVMGFPTVGSAEWFGFVLQSAPGTVVISHWETKPSADFLGGDTQVLDADPLTPGKNAISIGEEPIAIATDAAGCFEVTANAGSCDLSTLEINSAIDNHVINNVTIMDASTPVVVKRVQVKNASGTPIRARPAAMAAQPNTTVVGNLCPMTATGLVYVAYPSCHLVAAVDVSTGTMVAGIKFDATGPRVVGGNETCPAECADDLGKVDPVVPGVRPSSLALTFDPRVNTTRLAIGSDTPSITVVDLDAMARPISPVLQIPLEDPTGGKLGVTALALSPQIGMGGKAGSTTEINTPGGQGQYVYAVATDGTVRVADVLTQRRECDTQIDTRFLRTVSNVPLLQCLPIGDPTLPRRSGARGPGIELGSSDVPNSVAFLTAPPITDAVMDDPRSGAYRMLGHFAVITATGGLSYVVNVDDDLAVDTFVAATPQETAPALVIPHQLRDFASKLSAIGPFRPEVDGDVIGARSCSDLGPAPDTGAGVVGGPRSTSPPVRNVIPGPGSVSSTKVAELPSLHQVRCVDTSHTGGTPISEMQFAAELDVRDKVFPDLRALFADETWTLTWEGILSADTPTSFVDGPPVRDGQLFVDALGMYLRDPNRPFCEVGAEPFDIVQLRGCNPNNSNGDCPAGYTCYVHPQAVAPTGSGQVAIGQCMLTTEADRLATACRDFLTTSRRYTVAPGTVSSNQITLLPRKHELRTTPLDGCTSAAQCKALADYAAKITSTLDPINDRTPADPHTWACMVDDARAPINPDPAKNTRCIQTCAITTDCDAGSICQAGICMESVVPPPACVTGPERYDVRASEAFTVIGSRSGYVHPFKVDDTGKCVRDPQASRVQLGRIPLKAPACADPMTVDPITGKFLVGSGFEPNPCSLTVANAENEPLFSDTCSVTVTNVVDRNRPAIQFRNRGLKLTLVDPFYPGDARCIGDRGGALDRVPMVFPGYQLSFRQTGGYTPLTLPSITPVFPVKVIAGPTNSIWVVDDGDFLSNSFTQASTRGKVFRIETNNLFGINLLQ